MKGEKRLPFLDVAKGVAILFVIGIHAELGFPGVLYTHVISRAVPMFLVLFGMTSTMWWEKHASDGSLTTWYRSRLARLLPPYWLAVLVWWCGQRILSEHFVGVDALAWSLAGYAPWIQTSWFVTAILQLVLLFPILRAVTRSLGRNVCLVASLLVMVAAQRYALPLTEWLRGLLPHDDATYGFYAFWVFVPHYFFLVIFGMAFSTVGARRTWKDAILALSVVAAAGLVEPLVDKPSALSRVVMTIGDTGRAVLLLEGAAAVVPIVRLTALLAWLGRNSWEIYVGQMATHSLAYSAWCRAGGPAGHRVPYALLLLTCSVLFAAIYSELRRRLSGKRVRA
jgi:peptidoglycan/LPS O-acetylase OafA/YrhL